MFGDAPWESSLCRSPLALHMDRNARRTCERLSACRGRTRRRGRSLAIRACGQAVLLRLLLLDPQRLDADLRKLQVVAGGQAVSGSAAALRSLQLPARQFG